MTDAAVARARRGRRRVGLRGARRPGGSPRSTRPRPPSEAVEKAERTRGAIELEPGSYRAVLEPYAFAELLALLRLRRLRRARAARGAQLRLRARSASRSSTSASRSPTTRSTRAGCRRPSTSRARRSSASSSSRTACSRGVVWDRATAERAGGGQQSTGHAPPTHLRGTGARSRSRSRSPAARRTRTEELAELVGDGIYVTRLHYLSIVDPREGVVTGMTRDGTFRDPRRQDRRAARQPALHRLGARDARRAARPDPRAACSSTRTPFYDERYPNGVLAPAIATARFDVTGVGCGPGT